MPEVKSILSELIVSHKNARLLISPSKHRVHKEIKSGKIASIRGELHKETNYSKKNYFKGDKTDIVKLILNISESWTTYFGKVSTYLFRE